MSLPTKPKQMQPSDPPQESRTSSLLSLLHPSQGEREQQRYSSSPPGPQQSSHSQQPLGAAGDADLNRPTSISVDSLFRNITQAPQQQQQQQPSPAPSDLSGHAVDHPATSSDRQHALLSLLGNVASPSTEAQSLDTQPPPPPRGPPNNPNPMSAHENQGKLLLEQLMAGSGSDTQGRSQSSEIYRVEPYRSPSPPSFPSVPKAQSPPARHASPLNQEPATVDPTRKSKFEFVSPFDALSSPPPIPASSSSTKKKPVPPVEPTTSPTLRPVSPRAVEGPIQFPRRHMTPEQSGSHGHSDAESQTAVERPSNPGNRNYPRHSPDISYDSAFRPIPFAVPSSIRTSPLTYQPPPPPPPQSPPLRVAPTTRDSPVAGTLNSAESPGPSQPVPPVKDQESSSSGRESRGKREDLRPKAPVAPAPAPSQPLPAKSARVPPPSVASPIYALDMTAPLQSTCAPPGLTAVTPIALLKLENIYSQGTTIAVSGFIAYAMTRGRVRLIARSNGSRALLHLPSTFPPTTSATDMVVNGNLLACVTSDGGLVIWDVPAELDENPPVELVLHISATDGAYGLKLVKWHPKQSGTIAVASDREVYVFNVHEAHLAFQGERTSLQELAKISNVIQIPSPLVSFTFDSPQIALATISIDSTITLWSIKDKLPFWSGRVPGEGLPSSIDFLDGGLLVGRKQGTVLQLLPVMSAQVAATIKLTIGPKVAREDDESIFCHVGYDPRIKTVWVAHSARASLFAVRLSFDASASPSIDMDRSTPVSSPVVEQIAEFPTPMQCINMAILVSDDLDSTTAVASFAMHQGGVDQINIPMDTFENALAGTAAKLPPATYPTEKDKFAPKIVPVPPTPPKTLPQTQTPPQVQQSSGTSQRGPLPEPIRPRSPISDAEAPEATLAKGKGARVTKTAKEKEKPSKTETKPAAAEAKPEAKELDSTGLAKDLKKVEENLHTRIGKLLSKELDKQQSRIEELRRADQEADFARQETILKLISTELTKNTTRVVEQAIKSEVQNTVLPALEAITKNEIKAALSNQIAKGLADSMRQALPSEIERLLLRPDVSTHVARNFSVTVTPLIERHVKESITKTLIPAYAEATTAMQMNLSREISSEILNLKKEIVTWQGEALRGTESVMRDMEQTIRNLNEQVRTLSLQVQSQQSQPAPQHIASSHRSSPGLPPPILAQQSQHLQHPLPHPHLSNSSHLRQGSLATLGSSSLAGLLPQTQLPPPQNQAPGPSSYGSQGMWQSAPQSQSHYAPPSNAPPQQTYKPPPPPPQQQQQSQQQQQQSLPPPIQSFRQAEQQQPMSSHQDGGEDWDGTFLATLGKQDARQLRELLLRCNPEIIMPAKRELTPLSQAVVLTLIHRLSESLVELSSQDEAFRLGLWWLQRAAYTLNPNDPVISSYIGPVVSTAQAILNQTSSRLPSTPSNIESQNMISQIQRALSIKPS